MATAVKPDTERRHLDRSEHVTTRAQEIDHFLALSREARGNYELADLAFRELDQRERELQDGKDEAELAACLRLRDQVNPLTVGGLKFSGSAAQDFAKVDPAYAAYLTELRDVVFQKNAAITRRNSAKILAKSANAALNAMGG